jgi:uncharacterized integral membrane protein
MSPSTHAGSQAPLIVAVLAAAIAAGLGVAIALARRS